MEPKLEIKIENEEKDDDAVQYTLAQLYRYAAQNVDDCEHDQDREHIGCLGYAFQNTSCTTATSDTNNLDEKAKLVLKSLLDGATDRAFQFHSKVLPEKNTFSTNQISSQRGQTPKELLKMHSTSNRVSGISPSNAPSSVKSVSCNPGSDSKKRSRIHEEIRINRLNSLQKISSNNKGYDDTNIHTENSNALAFLGKSKGCENCKKLMGKRSCGVLGHSSDATSSLAVRISQSGANHLEGVNTNRVDKIFGVFDYDLAEAMRKTEETTLLDHQVLTQTRLNQIEKKTCIGLDLTRDVKERASQNSLPAVEILVSNWAANSVCDGNGLLRPQMPTPKNGCNKYPTMSGSILSQRRKSIQRESSFPSLTADQNDEKGKSVYLADRKTSNSKNALLSQQLSQKTARSGMSSRTKSRNQKCNSGIMPTSTSGPTLLRTATVSSHPKKDETHLANKRYTCDSNQGSSRWAGTKTSSQKDDQRHQIMSLPTLVEQKPPCVKNGTSSKSCERRSRTLLPKKHMPLQQGSETSWTSDSTSGSSYSSVATPSVSSTESGESLPSRTTAHPRGDPIPTSYLGRERSMKPSKRSSPYSMVGRPHQMDAIVHRKSFAKQVGRLQRFKNKLGLIFHHHHHHHHHHHDGATGAVEGGDRNVSKTSNSFWKYFQKMLHRGKTAGPRKKQADIGLVEGFIRQLRHLKKTKRSNKIKKLGKSNSHGKKVKKWHWWQKKFKHRAVVRQTSGKKPRVRAGFKTRKTALKAIKSS